MRASILQIKEIAGGLSKEIMRFNVLFVMHGSTKFINYQWLHHLLLHVISINSRLPVPAVTRGDVGKSPS